MGLTVYARSIPRERPGRLRDRGQKHPRRMHGRDGAHGDIIVADEDGVVVARQERAQEVLKKAQDIDDRERGMFPFIRQRKSLRKAIEAFNRI